MTTATETKLVESGLCVLSQARADRLLAVLPEACRTDEVWTALAWQCQEEIEDDDVLFLAE